MYLIDRQDPSCCSRVEHVDDRYGGAGEYSRSIREETSTDWCDDWSQGDFERTHEDYIVLICCYQDNITCEVYSLVEAKP